MLLVAVPPIDSSVVLIGVVVAAILATLAALVIRGARRRGQSPAAASPETRDAAQTAQGVVGIAAFDGSALLAAVKEAEAEGALHRLPGLYLSLAQWRVDEGETSAAADYFRKCIRAATTAGAKEPHARARVALGDIAQAAGDSSTACEHWQIARLLFHELRQTRDYQSVDERMQRNKCPTDWVLTDF